VKRRVRRDGSVLLESLDKNVAWIVRIAIAGDANLPLQGNGVCGVPDGRLIGAAADVLRK
jgi:hypothetical protein